jgi:hypothetical protein
MESGISTSSVKGEAEEHKKLMEEEYDDLVTLRQASEFGEAFLSRFVMAPQQFLNPLFGIQSIDRTCPCASKNSKYPAGSIDLCHGFDIMLTYQLL